MVAGMRNILVPALVISLGAILLPISGCKIVHNDQRGSNASSSTGSAFNAAEYVDVLWDKKLIPYFETDGNDLGSVIDEIKKDLDHAGKQYGRRADAEGSPWSFPVKSKAKVVSINTESRAGTLQVEISAPSGTQEVTLQIGPVIKGSAIRDATPFFPFEKVTNQLEFAQVGRVCNDRALKQIQSVLPKIAKAGETIEFTGAFSLTNVPESYIITLVSLKPASGGKQ